MKKIMITISVFLCSACASVSKGVNQTISVETSPEQNAQCTLQNTQGTWFVTSPGTTLVRRAYSPLSVTCKKPGYEVAHDQIPSKATVHVAGNIIFGGVIGAGVDMLDGAAYDYPDRITIPLRRRGK